MSLTYVMRRCAEKRDSRKHERNEGTKVKALAFENTAYFESGRIEIEKQTFRNSSCLEIGPKLSKVDVVQGIDRFQFDYQLTFDQKIKATLANGNVLVAHSHRVLVEELNTPLVQGNPKRLVIDRLEIARSQLTMHMNCSSKYSTRHLFEFMPHESPRKPFVLSCLSCLSCFRDS